MVKLSVNLNKVALLRNSRGQDFPHLETIAAKVLGYGAHGLTLHPRPDRRHALPEDVHDLRQLITKWNAARPEAPPVELNVEGYPSEAFLRLMEETRPDQCTLVPDPPGALTSNAGWRLSRHRDFLAPVVGHLHSLKIRSSLFVDPFELNNEELRALVAIHPDRVELYTERFAHAHRTPEAAAVTEVYAKTGRTLFDCGFGLNAGHDLNLVNLADLIQALPQLLEVSIGHALITEALDWGLAETTRRYLRILDASSQ